MTGTKEVNCPAWLLDGKGGLQKFMPQMDTSQGQCHLLLPSGQGDTAWVWSKMWKVHEDLKAQGRELIVHFPETGSNRVDPYARLMGMNVGEYIANMGNWREYPGEPVQEDFETGCIMYVHANVHIEGGKPLHVNSPRWKDLYDLGEEVFEESPPETWCPWLPYKIPTPPVVQVKGKYRAHGWGTREVSQFEEADPYIIMKIGSAGWMGQNWTARTYSKIVQKLEEVAPVMLMGYSPCCELPLIERTIALYQNHGGYCIDQSYESALTAVLNCKAMLSIDDGMSIMATYYGKNALRLYPDWLSSMPGTWEDVNTLHPDNSWCLIEDLKDGPLDRWIETITV